MNRRIRLTLLFVISAFVSAPTHAADTPNPADAPINFPGYIIMHGSSSPYKEVLEKFVKLSGGKDAKLVYILAEYETKETGELVQKTLEEIGASKVSVVSCEKADSKILDEATGIWTSKTQLRGDIVRLGCLFGWESGFYHKKVLLITGECTEFVALPASGTAGQIKSAGIAEALPKTVVGFQREKCPNRLPEYLKTHPDIVGIGVDNKATMIFHNRTFTAIDAPIQIHLAPSATRPALIKPLAPGQTADLNALIRAARARSQPPFPPADISAPGLESGTLVIDGGGIPKAALTRFIEAAGGPDALILACPTAQSDEPWDPAVIPNEAKLLMRAGAKNVKTFHLAKYADAFDEEKIKILREAKGLWFCGGRQWRYVDAYLDTPAEKLMHEILKRGGAIGGSSAGATIQGDYLVRGNPLGNVEMMSEGYERGFAFLKGAAIDQHFFKRNRFSDMSALKKTFPQLLGIGIDEGAALVVTGQTMEVVGLKSVAIYNKQSPPENGEKDYLELKPGEKYDLKTNGKLEEKK